MINEAEPLLISLKPTYADMVFSGLKTAELRRRIWREAECRDVFIYVSSPAKELRGGFRVGQVWEGSPKEIWATVSDLAGISENEFNSYYHGKNVAYALEITDVWEYSSPLNLENLRVKLDTFVAPQSYRYLKPKEKRIFQRLKRKHPITNSPTRIVA